MPQQDAQEQPKVPEGFQEGSRWINKRPDGVEFAKWFTDNVKLHAGLESQAEKYSGGIVLIGAKEKLKVAKLTDAGATVIVEEERMTYTPYAKVETRVAYFWDLMALHAADWLGVIEPVEVASLGEAGVYNQNLPPGFFKMPVQEKDGKIATHVGCAMVVKILDRRTLEWVDVKRKSYDGDGKLVDKRVEQILRGTPIFKFAPATKMVNVLNNYGDEDPFAVMKAETGAVGRALGMAGMLVIPGSGVSTAEDMQEAAAQAAGGSVDPAESARLPKPEQGAAKTGAADLDAKITEGIARLASEFTAEHEEFLAWAEEKKIDLADLKDSQRRPVFRMIERKLEAGIERRAQDETAEAT